MIYNFAISLVAELAIIILTMVGIGENTGSITIGVVMLIVSGIGVMNGMRDMIHKDIMSGVINVTNAVLGAVGIAAGIALPILLLKGVL